MVSVIVFVLWTVTVVFSASGSAHGPDYQTSEQRDGLLADFVHGLGELALGDGGPLGRRESLCDVGLGIGGVGEGDTRGLRWSTVMSPSSSVTLFQLDGLVEWQTSSDSLAIGQELVLLLGIDASDDVSPTGLGFGFWDGVSLGVRWRSGSGRTSLLGPCLGLGRGGWLGPSGQVDGRGGSDSDMSPDLVRHLCAVSV